MTATVRWAVLVTCALGIAVIAGSEQVERDGVNLMKGPGTFYPSVGTVGKGAQVQILETKGAWHRVRSGDTEGYIPASALASSGGGGPLSAGGLLGSKKASVSSDTAAAKGFNKDVEAAHAEKNQVDFAVIDGIEAQSIPSDVVLEFLRTRGLIEGEGK